MAFNGYLLKFNNVAIPYTYISAETYKATPNQRMESSAKRVTTGLLHRTTCDHTATKIEFNTPTMWNRDKEALFNIIRGGLVDVAQRKYTLEYFDTETDSYKTGTFYMPDVDYTIQRIDVPNNRILYAPMRICFIEY